MLKSSLFGGSGACFQVRGYRAVGLTKELGIKMV